MFPNFTVKRFQRATFANDVTVPTLIGQFSLKRGYVLVDASLDGVPFQFVSTHLAETHDSLEPAEVGEILTALGTTDERQIVVGDFNARPDEVCGGSPCGPEQMLAAGFADTGRGLGPTCCQSPTLDNPVSSLNNRYDYIFERGFHAIYSAALVGDQPFEEEAPALAIRSCGSSGNDRRGRRNPWVFKLRRHEHLGAVPGVRTALPLRLKLWDSPMCRRCGMLFGRFADRRGPAPSGSKPTHPRRGTSEQTRHWEFSLQHTENKLMPGGRKCPAEAVRGRKVFGL